LVFIWHICFGCVLTLLVATIWLAASRTIYINGWDLDQCTPIALLALPLFFIPVINLLYTYASINLMYQLCHERNEEGKVITIYIWKFGIHYSEYN